MRLSLRNLPRRTTDKAREAAAGSVVPAGQEQPTDEATAVPAAGERASMRRRVRRLGRMREVLLRELGALVVELRRLERENPGLIARKAAEVGAIDEQLRGLRAALGDRQTVEQVVVAGVAGTCARCGTLMAVEDRFCPRCGRAVSEPAGTHAGAAGAATGAEAAPAANHGIAAESSPAAEAPTAAAAAPPPPPPPPPPPDRPQAELTASSQPQP